MQTKLPSELTDGADVSSVPVELWGTTQGKLLVRKMNSKKNDDGSECEQLDSTKQTQLLEWM